MLANVLLYVKTGRGREFELFHVRNRQLRKKRDYAQLLDFLLPVNHVSQRGEQQNIA